MIEIIHYERANKNKVIGYADIILPEMTLPRQIIRRIAHIQSGDKKWFNLPNFNRENGGAPNYVKYWQFETEVFNSQLLEKLPPLVEAYCLENKIADLPSLSFEGGGESFKESELPF